MSLLSPRWVAPGQPRSVRHVCTGEFAIQKNGVGAFIITFISLINKLLNHLVRSFFLLIFELGFSTRSRKYTSILRKRDLIQGIRFLESPEGLEERKRISCPGSQAHHWDLWLRGPRAMATGIRVPWGARSAPSHPLHVLMCRRQQAVWQGGLPDLCRWIEFWHPCFSRGGVEGEWPGPRCVLQFLCLGWGRLQGLSPRIQSLKAGVPTREVHEVDGLTSGIDFMPTKDVYRVVGSEIRKRPLTEQHIDGAVTVEGVQHGPEAWVCTADEMHCAVCTEGRCRVRRFRLYGFQEQAGGICGGRAPGSWPGEGNRVARGCVSMRSPFLSWGRLRCCVHFIGLYGEGVWAVLSVSWEQVFLSWWFTFTIVWAFSVLKNSTKIGLLAPGC